MERPPRAWEHVSQIFRKERARRYIRLLVVAIKVCSSRAVSNKRACPLYERRGGACKDVCQCRYERRWGIPIEVEGKGVM